MTKKHKKFYIVYKIHTVIFEQCLFTMKYSLKMKIDIPFASFSFCITQKEHVKTYTFSYVLKYFQPISLLK